MDSSEVFALFVSAINRQDVEALGDLMAAEHLFVDPQGNRIIGAEPMRAGWRAYFAMCPDYSVHVDTLMANGDVVLATGEAGGMIDGVTWRTPAAWKSLVRAGKVVEWRVFADNKPVYEILAKRS